MFRAGVGASRRLRWGILALTAIVVLVTLGTDPAEARRRRWTRSSYSPPYAAIVVDANTGQILHANNADSLRHPASLTKIMTLYLLFEQIEAGKLKLDSRLSVSSDAARQSPTKLGLRPGSTIEVEDAIKGLVTRSANDAAVVIAEAIGGDEDRFARMMTRKAQSLGMSRTVYRNASGLPDHEQVTTARDQALLGRAIQDRFPRYYRYFATASSYRGVAIRNHNHLLGRVEGVDGIKTGYTRDSGFNLVTSVKRDSRHIVAVVLGGASSRAPRCPHAQPDRRTYRGWIDEAHGRPHHRGSGAARRRGPRQGAHRAGTRSGCRARGTRTRRLPRPHLGGWLGRADQGNPIKTLTVKRASLASLALAPATLTAPAPAPPTAPAAKQSTLSMAAATTAPRARSGWSIQIGAYPEEDEARERLKVIERAAGRGRGDQFPSPSAW